MAILSRPTCLVQIALHKYPASSGIQYIRISPKDYPVALPGAFFQPRLYSAGPATRAATDVDGNLEVGKCEFDFIDEDGELGALLDAGEETEFWIAREIAAFLPSQELLDTEPDVDDLQPVFRGWITDVQRVDRHVHVTAADVVGALMSASNLDRKVLQRQIKDIVTTPLEDTKELWLPLAIGEYSDKGATNSEGQPAQRGVWPVIEMCEIDITDLAGTAVKVFAAPPVITASSVTGTTGEETLYYGATLITPYGESSMSNIVSCNGANRANRNVSNYNEISGTFDLGDPLNPNKVRIWFGTSPTMVGWYDEANYDTPGTFGYFDGAAAWPTATRNELDDPKYMSPPLSNAAQTNPNIFSVMGVCLGYGYEMVKDGTDEMVFASDLAEGQPKRAIVPAGDHGVTTITNADPQWPFPNPWIEMNGVRFFGFLQRGPKLQHHRDGAVTMSVCFCGPHDGSGKLIDQALRQFAFLLNEYCVRFNGSGNLNANYFTLETYANGDALIKTEDFEALQDITKGWLGDDVGYQGNIWVTDPEETWRDVIAKCCTSWGIHLAPTRFGQITVFAINTDDTDGTGLRHFREGIEIKRSEAPRMAHDEVINKGRYNYFWDVDMGDFRGKEIPILNATSIAQQVPGGVIGGSDRRGERPHDFNIYYSAYPATVSDVVTREMLRRKRRPRYPSVTLPLLGVDHDLGEECKLTDSKGLGPVGDDGARVQILRHELHFDEEEVTLVFQDLRSVRMS